MWTVERTRSGLRLRDARGTAITDHAVVIARPATREALIAWNGKRYRGEIVVHATDTGLVVVNRVPMESYLRGVVPLEMGRRTAAEREAMAAQAIAARSYAYLRLRRDETVAFDLRATTMDQVYGGVEAEDPLADQAVARTAGLVLKYDRRVVSAPYHSTCGGTTAAAPEVWRTAGEPHLRRVSDRIPGSERFYCDVAPRFRWTRSLDRATLTVALERYLRSYAAVPARAIGNLVGMEVEERTGSGRVARLAIVTDRGRYHLRGNDIRFVLRESGGEILNSTYFSLASTTDDGGRVSRIILRGNGYGHGVGMCQWGAVGRARAGQDFRAILRAYFPGTTVGIAR